MKPYNTDQTKKEEVREMFDNIAPKYDLLNHTLSMSIDRVWRRRVVGEVRRAKPGRILDVATGTGDLAIAMARRIRDVQVLGVDFEAGRIVGRICGGEPLELQLRCIDDCVVVWRC